MDAKMYSKMPTEIFFQALDGQLLTHLLLRQYGQVVKTSSGPKFDSSGQLYSYTFKGLGNQDHIGTLQYVQEILTSR